MKGSMKGRWNRGQLLGMMQALAGMPEVWPRDAALGTRVTCVIWDVPLQELELCRTLWERDAHAARLSNPYLVWKSTARARERGDRSGKSRWGLEPQGEGRSEDSSLWNSILIHHLAWASQAKGLSLSAPWRKRVTRGCLPTDWPPQGAW